METVVVRDRASTANAVEMIFIEGLRLTSRVRELLLHGAKDWHIQFTTGPHGKVGLLLSQDSAAKFDETRQVWERDDGGDIEFDNPLNIWTGFTPTPEAELPEIFYTPDSIGMPSSTELAGMGINYQGELTRTYCGPDGGNGWLYLGDHEACYDPSEWNWTKVGKHWQGVER